MRCSEAKVASAARDLEGPVCDLVNMLKLVVNHFDGLLEADTTEKGKVTMLNWEADLAMFAIYHASSMAGDLQRRFYAAIEGKEAGDA